MKKDYVRPSGEKLLPIEFSALNIMYEHPIQNRYEVLKPDNVIDKAVLYNTEPIWCECIGVFLWYGKDFRSLKEQGNLNNCGSTLIIKKPFKLLYDEHQHPIIKCNEFTYFGRDGVSRTIRKPYVAVLFDESTEYYFLCLDLFRHRNSPLELKPPYYSVFHMSMSYEEMYLGLQKRLFKKFIFEYGSKICDIDNRKCIKSGTFFSNVTEA